MRVLVLSQHFPPETIATGRRAFDIAEELSSRGHEVMVVAGRPNHPGSTGPGPAADGPGPTGSAPYRVYRVPVWRTTWSGPLQRILTYATFTLNAAWRATTVARRSDVIIAISALPTGFAALVAAWLVRRPLIYDLQDIWPESALACGVLGDGPVFRLLRRLERFLYRRCAAFTVISPGFAAYLEREGVDRRRIHVVHNGVDMALFDGQPADEEFVRRHGLAGKFVVLYFGNVGLAQRLDTLLDTAAALRGERDVAFVIMGNGVDRARLVALAEARALDNCHLVPAQPRDRVPGIVAAAHVLLIMLRKAKLFEITVPSKIYECLASARPIVCAVAGDAAAIVSGAGGGVCVPPEDPKALAEAILTIRGSYERFARQAAEARRHVACHYSRGPIGGQFEEVCRDVVAQGRR